MRQKTTCPRCSGKRTETDDDGDDDDYDCDDEYQTDQKQRRQDGPSAVSTPEDILGHEGISETDLYRFSEDLDDMVPTIPDQYTTWC